MSLRVKIAQAAGLPEPTLFQGLMTYKVMGQVAKYTQSDFYNTNYVALFDSDHLFLMVFNPADVKSIKRHHGSVPGSRCAGRAQGPPRLADGGMDCREGRDKQTHPGEQENEAAATSGGPAPCVKLQATRETRVMGDRGLQRYEEDEKDEKDEEERG